MTALLFTGLSSLLLSSLYPLQSKSQGIRAIFVIAHKTISKIKNFQSYCTNATYQLYYSVFILNTVIFPDATLYCLTKIFNIGAVSSALTSHSVTVIQVYFYENPTIFIQLNIQNLYNLLVHNSETIVKKITDFLVKTLTN